jgi:hypothetical protein
MDIRHPTAEETIRWALIDAVDQAAIVLIGGPDEGEGDGVIPCPTVVTITETGPVLRVAYQPNEIEVAQLAKGATLWFTFYGPLPIHTADVVGGRE